MPDNARNTICGVFWTPSWSSIFLRVFFPGNLVWKIWRGRSSPEVMVLARACDGMDETTSSDRNETKLIITDTHTQPILPLVGIEYVDIM